VLSPCKPTLAGVDWDDLTEGWDGEDRHPRCREFVDEWALWIPILETNRGTDNDFGGLYVSEHRSCVCAVDGADCMFYAWNVAKDLEEVDRLWKAYCDLVKSGEPMSGFVDWLVDTHHAIGLTNIGYGDDPFAGAPAARPCTSI